MSTAKGTHRRWLGLALRATITVAIVAFLVTKLDWSHLAARMREADYRWLALACLCFGAAAMFGAVRWWYLIRIQGIVLPLRVVAILTLIGQFFNSFMFGAVGGDVVKALYLYRYAPGQKTHATLSVLIDRALGLFVLLCGSLLVLPWQLRSLRGTEAASTALTALIVVFALMVTGGLVLFLTPFHRAPARLQALWKRVPHHRIAELVVAGFRQHGAAPGLTLGAVAAGIGVTLALVAGGHCIALGIGLPVGYLQLLVIVTVAICVTSLPISIGGHGVREGIFVLMFAAFGAIAIENGGSENAILFSVLFFAIPLVWSLLGGVLYLTFRHAYQAAS
ncbi:MAG: lysylphosphatidylglycerol synthase transmembrane domain-containing protein [Burkholderiales bacterium]